MRGPPDLSSTIERFAVPMLRRRYNASTVNADGLRRAGSVVETTIRAHAYEVDVGDLERAPEGYTSRRALQGTTTFELRLGNESTRTRADEIVFDGDTWEVVSVTEVHGGPTGATTYFIFGAVKVTREESEA